MLRETESTYDVNDVIGRSLINPGFMDRLGVLEKEFTPVNVSHRLRQAARGDLGPLQESYLKMSAAGDRFAGLVRRVKFAITSYPFHIGVAESYSDDAVRAARLAKDMFNPNHLDINQIMKDFVEAYVAGIRVFEPMWDVRPDSDGKPRYMVRSMKRVAPGRYMMNTDRDSAAYGEITLASTKRFSGIPLSEFPAAKILTMTDGTKPLYFDLAGAARSCLSWFLFKIYSAKFWAEFNQSYGEPWRIVKYPHGAEDDDELMSLIDSFLEELGRSGWARFPDGIEVELHEAQRAGTVKTYSDLIRMSNDSMAIALLGQVQTSDGGQLGSYAKAVVQQAVEYDIIKGVAEMVAQGFRYFMKHAVWMNFGRDFPLTELPDVGPVIERPGDRLDKAKMFDTATKYIDVPVGHIRHELGIPKPIDGEDVVGPSTGRDISEIIPEETLQHDDGEMDED